MYNSTNNYTLSSYNMQQNALVHMILSTQGIEKEYERQICWQAYDNIRLCSAGSDIHSSFSISGRQSN